MLTATAAIGSGMPGIEYTLQLITSWKNYYGTLPAIRKAALIVAGSAADDDQAAQAAALAQFVKVSLVYQADPVNSEFIQSPDLLLIAISRDGTAPGDCDDHVTLFCAMAESLGIACDAAGVAAPGSDTINHVIAVVHLTDRDVDVDLCAKTGWQPAYPDKLIVTDAS
jgi:transglutaminase-like putative cysteine protease